MKMWKRCISAALALAFAAASLPAWACVHGCRTPGPGDLACVRACARSAALLTQDGRLAGVSAGSCQVRMQPALNPAVLAKRVDPSPVTAPLAILPQATASPSGIPGPGALPVRGPPCPDRFLSYAYPFANGPPSLL